MNEEDSDDLQVQMNERRNENNKRKSAKYTEEPHHVNTGGFLYMALFSWIFPLVRKGMKKTLELEDLRGLPTSLKSEATLKKLKFYLEREYKRTGDNANISLLRVYVNLCFSKLMVHATVFGLGECAGFVAVGIVGRYLFEYIESPTNDLRYGCTLVILLVICIAMRMIGSQLGHFFGVCNGCYAKSAFLALIYDKALRSKTTGNKSIGELINLCANDATRILEFSRSAPNIVVSLFLIIMVNIYLVIYIGPVALVSFGIVFLFISTYFFIARLFVRLRKKTVVISDKRVKMISEALTFVKLIKMYAWETPIANVVYRLRQEERYAIQWFSFLASLLESNSYIIISVAPVFTIITAIYLNQEMSISKAFTLVSVYAIMKGMLETGQLSVRRLAEMLVSLRRIKDFLNMEEIKAPFKECMNVENDVELLNANFAWNVTNIHEVSEAKDDVPDVKIIQNGGKTPLISHRFTNCDIESFTTILKDITLQVKKKSLVGICGPIGSGKSSFLQALLNEMETVSGTCRINSSIAYVSQQPWIMNATMRDNITVGNEYENQFFREVCTACALDEDLKGMPSGDLTEVGERGITLSGGQKQRVSLARALYSKADIYLLDDPLSAVDSHVGKYIFENYIKRLLQDSTILLVTHQLQYIRECDYVIYMRDGCFSEQGTYSNLMENNSLFAQELENYQLDHCAEENLDEFNGTVEPDWTAGEIENVQNEDQDEGDLIAKGRIVADEDKKKGAVSLATYHSFIKFCGGYFAVLFMLLAIASGVVFQVVTDYWLALWFKKSNTIGWQHNTNITEDLNNTLVNIEFESQRDYYMIIYGILSCCMIVTTILSAFYTAYLLLAGSTSLHNAVFKVIFASPMAFFDTTPSGRILNRLSKDVDDIDNYLPTLLRTFIQNVCRTTGILIFIAISIPYFLIVIFVMIVLFGYLNLIYRRVVRAIKRIENVTRSPIYSHILATAQGLVTIRSFRKQTFFKHVFRQYLDCNIAPLLYFQATTRWFGINVDTICIFCAFSVCTAVILLKGKIPSAIAVMCVSYGIRVFGLVQYTIRLFSDVEAKFTGVERLDHFLKELKPEREFLTENKQLIEQWPMNGEIEFQKVTLRYRQNLPLVLNEISVKINDKEKIGIVGRTGAGKSSMGIALYRLVNPESGYVKVSGVDIKDIGLSDLRSGLTIIPQDPVLFIGTIRYNLDPFGQYDDEKLWNSLGKAHIKELVSNLPMMLESPVQENGSNFSVGERQLLCMARALLRKTKILILDEATASIDSSSDSKIQETIRECFSDCTVLTIAHRLNTIMDCDKILVLSDGKVVEFDTPAMLLSRDSIFRSMKIAASI